VRCVSYHVAVGNVHPVIVVPPHGAVPICAKAGGPIVDGVPTGIVQGTYYVRKVGPSSSGIVNATEWGPVIRRCTMHDRAALLAAISGVMQGPAEAAPQADEVIRTWHNAAHEAFLQDVANTPGAPPNLARWHWQFTYGITHQNDANIELNALQAELERAGNEVRDLVQTGWSMFHVFTRYGIAPVFSTDPAIGHGDHEFLTASMLRDPDLEPPEVSIGQDLWRVSPVGLATIVRDYWEDGLEWNQRLNFQSGTTFDPGLMVRSIAEGVRHARALAERFEGAMAVTFRLEWFGLEGRVTRIPDRMLWRDNVSQTDHCVANGTWPATTLTADWATVVAALVGPVARAFGIVRVVTSDWILRQAPSWIDGRR